MRKKSYKLEKRSENFFKDAAGESLSQCNFLKKYFKSARSHTSIDFDYKVANFYCGRESDTFLVKEIGVIETNIELVRDTDNEIIEAFIEFAAQPRKDRSGPRAIKLLASGNYIGHFLVDTECLIATDWTHTRSLVETCEKIISFLADSSLLTEFDKGSEYKPKIKVQLGGDPEFECLDSNHHVVNAENYFASMSGKIGRDGSGMQLELRPTPQETVTGILKEMNSLIKQASEVCLISSEGNRYPLGGHIHFSFVDESGNIVNFNNETCTHILDDFLGFTVNWSGEARGSYKSRRAYRDKNYGFEYRTPPATVWESPQILRIVLKLSKSVLEKATEGIEYEMTTRGIPSKPDYLNFISEREYQKLMSWRDKTPGHSVTKNWGGKVLPPKPRIEVVFNDEWQSSYSDHISREIRGWNVNSPLTIVLYGLGRNRGRVIAGFTSSHCETVENMRERHYYGFPYHARRENSSLLLNLLDDLKAHLQTIGIVEA